MLTKVVLFIGLLFCIAQNIFQTFQLEHGLYYSDDATCNFYKQRLFKWDYQYNDLLAYDNDEIQPDENKLVLIQNLATENFEDSKGLIVDSVIKKEGKYALHLNPGKEFNGSLLINLNTSQALAGDYLKLTAWAYTDRIPGIYEMGKVITELKRGDESLKWNSVRIENKLKPDNNKYTIWWGQIGKWKMICFFVRLPDNYKGNETFKVYPWNTGGANYWIDDIKVELWRKYK